MLQVLKFDVYIFNWPCFRRSKPHSIYGIKFTDSKQAKLFHQLLKFAIRIHCCLRVANHHHNGVRLSAYMTEVYVNISCEHRNELGFTSARSFVYTAEASTRRKLARGLYGDHRQREQMSIAIDFTIWFRETILRNCTNVVLLHLLISQGNCQRCTR